MSVLSLPILRHSRSPAHDRPGRLSLVEQFIAEQQALTAVDRFARRHDGARHARPTNEKYYRDLIPVHAPGPGQQYAFEVDLDACTGCKACVTACHNLNGLDEDETWRNVGLLVGGPDSNGAIQHVTTACHHCLEPACLEGCPVLAYEKDPVTGIVRHLDDQCIGCQYCVLKCPYDVPKYNQRLGIVRKCDMCSSRLAEGEAPACVQGCPNSAIRVRLVDVADARADAHAGRFVPAAPAPDYTQPTTRYRSRRGLPEGVRAADDDTVVPQHVHWSLVFMLVLTQMSVGAFVALLWVNGPVQVPLAITAAAVGVIGLNAALLHLGRPLYAFRAFLGIRTSWLSREVVSFGGFAKLALALATLLWLGWMPPGAELPVKLAVVGAGLAGVICSAMLYHDTRRPFWCAGLTFPRFLGTTALLGLQTAITVTAIGRAVKVDVGSTGRAVLVGLIALAIAKLGIELRLLRRAGDPNDSPLKRSALLLMGPFRGMTVCRMAFGVIGGVILPLIAMCVPQAAAAAGVLTAGLVASIAGELLERALFFGAVVPLKMPGAAA